jgi:endonuclease/exonuclease/phosphatase family metal-dependent hydrolase
MKKSLSVITYNVHSCVGMDRKTSPSRIAEVIAQHGSHIVALQELDVGLLRTGWADQAQLIAQQLNMHYHFHPSLRIEKGQYGNAILSRYPMRLRKAGELPSFPSRTPLERRGALWAEIDVLGQPVQLVNTHFGLTSQERLLQAETLLGSQWRRHPDCSPPVVMCGDLNAHPRSEVYRSFRKDLMDVQRALPGKRPRKTWPSFFPVFRLDYVFVTPDILTKDFRVPRTPLTRIASDHLPLIAELEIELPET